MYDKILFSAFLLLFLGSGAQGETFASVPLYISGEPEGLEDEAEADMGDLALQESELVERIVRRVAERIRNTNKN